MKNNAGITLIELMIVIAIIAMLIGVTAIGASTTLPNYRLSSTIQELRSNMRMARLVAVKRNTNVAMTFDTATDVCLIFEEVDPPNGTLDAGETILYQVNSASGIDLYAATVGAVRFNSRGFPNVAGEIHLKNSLDGYQGIRFGLTGNPTIIKSTDNGSTWQ